MNQRSRALAGAVLVGALATACTTSSPATAVPAPPGPSTPAGTVQPSKVAISTASPIATVTPNAAHILATVAVPSNPNGMLYAYGSIWVASRHSSSVYRIDPATATVTAKIGVGPEPAYFVDDGTAVWVVDFGAPDMSRIDPATNVSDEMSLPGDPGGAPAFGHGRVWQDTSAGAVGIDVVTRKVSDPIVGGSPGVAFGGGYVLFAVDGGPGIRRIDPVTMKDHDIIAPKVDASALLHVSGDVLWTASDSAIERLDPVTGKVLGSYMVPTEVDTGMSVPSGGRLWIQRGYPDGFAMIDPDAKEPSAFQQLPGPVTDSLYFVSVNPHQLWVSDWDANAVYEIDPAP